ncbi:MULTISPECIES: cold-shock protein [Actinomycetes]|uniref:cold-shock protein n=1 Tax=Actinomycetes TaxID=1760 RepID=UPI0006602D6F|nr:MULTISPECIES: cold shock domain-containing protein [Actinomycetes]MCM3898860.1 cold shock domain-containing protein [Schaalia meyeri]
MTTGTVKWFNDAKGFGFITPDDRSVDVFVHYSNIVGQSGRRTLMEGERVEYEAIDGPKGPQATDVARAE